MSAKLPSSDIVKSYLKRFPTTPHRTLARKIYNENKKCFNSVQHVNGIIRYYRGKSGVKLRKTAHKSEFLDQKIEFELPKSYATDYSPYCISQSRILIISDLHFPYQDNHAIRKAIEYGKEQKVNCILINGDLFDFAGISRHEKDWRQRSVTQEFEAVRTFLSSLRKHFPKAKIVYKLGNHDERWEKWLFLKAPEIFDDPEFKLETRLKLGELKIDIVKDKLPIKIGKLTCLHGHELAGGSGGVNPARATFLKTLDSVLVGHYHKTSQHTEASMYQEVFSVNSVGCLCDLTPHYMPINKHNHGFAYVDHDIKSGNYTLHNLKIIKGKVY
jgi:predicted phosphodiesterase